jgi:hypothetical protein
MMKLRDLFRMLLWACMPLYFGNEADRSKNNQTVTTTDQSQILAAGGVAARDGGIVQITTTDQGAIASAADTINSAVSEAFTFGARGQQVIGDNFGQLLSAQSTGLAGFMDSLDDLLGFATLAQQTAQQATESTSQLVATAYQGASDSASGNRTLILVGMAVVGVLSVALIFRKS